ncbi:SprT family zinc-dependent metalloprotease [Poseidonibacter sp. 1_MG-2023]|uniref:M48 family metallopeptidase n=1 Tax=Poseidonibacter TaxID=2321187 RepID=UPI001E3593FD|nr:MULTISPECIES: SprT family zinc-dependent metalloprotease [Poseidonibacter]MDO6827927.1 SprT family zinc-dependent metalloprotease [Poseidonibacter sp. 1_MG-2023]
MESITTHNVKVIKKDIKNITLKVKPNCDVILTVPLKTDDKHITYILEKRKSWISKNVEFFEANNKVEKKEYVSGESFKYLGKNYRLKVIESNIEQVKLLRGYIQIFVKDKTNINKKQKLLNEWYILKAEKYFQKVVEEYLSIVKKEVKNIKIRQMKTRWGSCNTSKGYINLNSELIKKRRESIEYVIFHELAHLVHPNHSREFYNYLDTYMPDWKKRKDKLEYK